MTRIVHGIATSAKGGLAMTKVMQAGVAAAPRNDGKKAKDEGSLLCV